MNIDSKDTPLVLLCPAWTNWGTGRKLKPQAIILHSTHDDVISFANSELLVANGGLPAETLIEDSDRSWQRSPAGRCGATQGDAGSM